MRGAIRGKNPAGTMPLNFSLYNNFQLRYTARCVIACVPARSNLFRDCHLVYFDPGEHITCHKLKTACAALAGGKIHVSIASMDTILWPVLMSDQDVTPSCVLGCYGLHPLSPDLESWYRVTFIDDFLPVIKCTAFGLGSLLCHFTDFNQYLGYEIYLLFIQEEKLPKTII